jgi:hypothetical protein
MPAPEAAKIATTSRQRRVVGIFPSRVCPIVLDYRVVRIGFATFGLPIRLKRSII